MTEQEAKYEIIEHKPIIGFPKYVKALNIAIKALEEVQQYRAIGTIKGYKRTIEVSKENYSLYLEYKEKVKTYETIGTPEECREAVEKQIPKKITHPGCFDNEGVWHTWNGIDGVPYDLCPNCETNLCTDGVFGRDKKKMKYCENCGQKLDFGE